MEGPTTNPAKIRQHMTTFYKNLYSSKSEHVDVSYLNDLDANKLTQQQQEELDREITVTKIGRALKELKSNKTLGVDCLLPEFYKVFWRKLKNFIADLYEEIIKDGKFHLSAR